MGSPDASAGVPDEHYSVLYKGTVQVPADGVYVFAVDHDGFVQLEIGGRTMKAVQGARAVTRFEGVMLKANQANPMELKYSHASGPSSLRLTWSGPGLSERPVDPHPLGGGL